MAGGPATGPAAGRGGRFRVAVTAVDDRDLKYCTRRSMLKNWRSWSGTRSAPSNAVARGGGHAAASRHGSNSMPVENTVCAGVAFGRRSSEGTCEEACGERRALDVGESMWTEARGESSVLSGPAEERER